MGARRRLQLRQAPAAPGGSLAGVPAVAIAPVGAVGERQTPARRPPGIAAPPQAGLQATLLHEPGLLQYFDDATLLRLASTNRHWRSHCEAHALWQQRFCRRSGLPPQALPQATGPLAPAGSEPVYRRLSRSYVALQHSSHSRPATAPIYHYFAAHFPVMATTYASAAPQRAALDQTLADSSHRRGVHAGLLRLGFLARILYQGRHRTHQLFQRCHGPLPAPLGILRRLQAPSMGGSVPAHCALAWVGCQALRTLRQLRVAQHNLYGATKQLACAHSAIDLRLATAHLYYAVPRRPPAPVDAALSGTEPTNRETVAS